MRKILTMRMGILIAILLTGCASVGTNFVRIPDNILVLGKTTKLEIISQLGPPAAEGTSTTISGKKLEWIRYTYAYTGGVSVDEGRVPARAQHLNFFENRLVGYGYISSFKTDATNFDHSKVPEIKTGISTRNDVQRLIGLPGGKSIYPLVINPDEDAVTYSYVEKTESGTRFKNLQVTFNKRGIVTDVVYKQPERR